MEIWELRQWLLVACGILAVAVVAVLLIRAARKGAESRDPHQAQPGRPMRAKSLNFPDR